MTPYWLNVSPAVPQISCKPHEYLTGVSFHILFRRTFSENSFLNTLTQPKKTDENSHESHHVTAVNSLLSLPNLPAVLSKWNGIASFFFRQKKEMLITPAREKAAQISFLPSQMSGDVKYIETDPMMYGFKLACVSFSDMLKKFSRCHKMSACASSLNCAEALMVKFKVSITSRCLL